MATLNCKSHRNLRPAVESLFTSPRQHPITPSTHHPSELTPPRHHRPPTRQALGHRARHCLQPRRLPRRPRPRLRRDLPPSPGRQLQGGVLQVEGGRLRRRRLGHLPRRLRGPDLRRRRPHQRHRHPQLQGRRLLGDVNLLRQLCTIRTSSQSSASEVKLELTNTQFIAQVFTEKRPLDTIAVGALARVFETVGLSLFLTWWGTRTNPFD